MQLQFIRRFALPGAILASFMVQLALAQDRGKKAALQSSQEKVGKLVDLARRLRATGRYDGAVAAYLKAKDISVTKNLKRGIVTECGEVLEFQKKYKKALQIYSQARLSGLELRLLIKLKFYRRGISTARLYNQTRYEGDCFMALGQFKEALKVYRLGHNRKGEAKALIKMKFPEKGVQILIEVKQFEDAAKVYQTLKKPNLAKTQWQLAKGVYEKRLIKLVNDIRLYRSELDPAKRKKRKLSELTDFTRRVLRLKLARRYRLCADSYEDLANAQEALGNRSSTKKLLQGSIKFYKLYQKSFTDDGKDQFGVDRINQSDFLIRIGKIQKRVDGS
jgi:tetratricopeptide (TPR) repeat protein